MPQVNIAVPTARKLLFSSTVDVSAFKGAFAGLDGEAGSIGEDWSHVFRESGDSAHTLQLLTSQLQMHTLAARCEACCLFTSSYNLDAVMPLMHVM